MMTEMARLCHLVEDYKKAASYFAEVLKALEAPRKHNISPKVRSDLLGENGATYQLIGSCLLKAGNVEAAEAAFRKGEAEAPGTGRASFNAASIHRHAGRFEEALKELDVSLKSHPGEKGTGPLLLLEETLNELGRGDDLIDYLASLQKDQPENTPLAYFLAQKLFLKKQYDRAEQICTSLIDAAPTSTAYQYLLEIYLSRSEYEKAAGILAAVAEKTGTLDALGESLELVDRFARSRGCDPLSGQSVVTARRGRRPFAYVGGCPGCIGCRAFRIHRRVDDVGNRLISRTSEKPLVDLGTRSSVGGSD